MSLRSPVLVPLKFNVNSEGPVFLDIEARKKGFWAWLLSKLGLFSRRKLVATAGGVEYSVTSAFGIREHSVPLDKISRVSYGIARPLHLLFSAVVFILGAIALIVIAVNGYLDRGTDRWYNEYAGEWSEYSYGMDDTTLVVFGVISLLLLLIACRCFVLYRRRKPVYLAIESDSGFDMGLSMRNASRRLVVNEESVRNASAILKELVRVSHLPEFFASAPADAGSSRT